MKSFTKILASVFVASILASVESRLIKRRPHNDVGKLLISEDDNHDSYNENRLMVFFDLDCLTDSISSSNIGLGLSGSSGIASAVGIGNIGNSNNNNKPSITRDHYSSQQTTYLDSIINNHYPCLSHTTNKDGKVFHYQHSKSDEYNYGISFLDIDSSNNCITDDSSSSQVSLNYTDHCLDMVSYEPLYSLSPFTDTTFSTLEEWNCQEVTTSQSTGWGLDCSDGETLDNSYSYPNYMNESNGVDLYILDTGIMSNHIEFANVNVTHVIGNGPTKFNYTNDDGTVNYTSIEYHGTHVASTAGGDRYGHAHNIDMFDYAVCDYIDPTDGSEFNIEPLNGCWTSLLIQALDDIYTRLANNDRRGVINLSLGGTKSFFDYFYEYYFDLIRDNGGITVVAAGNENQDACNTAPAWSTSVITVGSSAYNSSLDGNGYQNSGFSNWGSCVDIYGPGSDIYAALAVTADVAAAFFGTTPDQVYYWLSGTSMASPAVAGTVANMLMIEPTLSHYEVVTLLQLNSFVISEGNYCGEIDLNDTDSICLQYLQNCSAIPSSYFNNGSLAPSTSADPNTDNTANITFDLVENTTCNTMAVVTIDRTREDTDNYMNYAVDSIEYVVTDKCISSQEGADQYYSYDLECVDEDTARLYSWNADSCDGDGYLVKEFYTGMIDGDDIFIVNCENDEEEDNSEYDNSDCDIVWRLIWSHDYKIVGDPLTSGETEYECIYDEDTTYWADFAWVNDLCYYNYTKSGMATSYKYVCSDDGESISVTQYDGEGCEEGSATSTYTYVEDTCYGSDGYRVQILECGGNSQDDAGFRVGKYSYHNVGALWGVVMMVYMGMLGMHA